ncbi:Blastomere cadherin [Merluccius polli]|uniref:Blastomere cadherin n=1 Tax=Merluccius polli TaxID=89951 RepID=A0AA47MS09_MERPO|nr:Blastomere cadherin [Merluccius polli]
MPSRPTEKSSSLDGSVLYKVCKVAYEALLLQEDPAAAHTASRRGAAYVRNVSRKKRCARHLKGQSPDFVLAVAEDSEVIRKKREWIIAPRKLEENKDYTKDEYIAKIRSDHEYSSRVTYSLFGKGAHLDPKGRFSVDQASGLVKVNSILDREEFANYTLLGVAKYDNGSLAEKDIELGIIVLDQNDCSPVFQITEIGYVNESSAAGIPISPYAYV